MTPPPADPQPVDPSSLPPLDADAADPGPTSLERIAAARARLGDLVLETPAHTWRGREIAAATAPGTEVVLKLELFQYTGTFKPRGALLAMMALPPAVLARGVTAVSAGNHAIAVAYAARRMGVPAKVVMIASASPARVEACRAWGAEVVLADTVQDAFAECERIAEAEGRSLIHPFEGPWTALGTATVGAEFMAQAPGLDAVIVPIGGGGLAAGIATAVKLVQPGCAVYGVEPEGADSMSRSFAAGEPRAIEKVTTIADSLGAPFALPYSFGLCRRHVDEVVRLDDDALARATAMLFREMKLAVEPAGAAATAALCGPLRDRLAGKRVGLIVCGTNIDIDRFADIVRRGGPPAAADGS
ncbi:MAG: threonine/serine dehydratase [Azospirillaceae bacterium]